MFESAARRLGHPLGGTLEALARQACATEEPGSSFAALGLQVPLFHADVELPAEPEAVPVGVIPIGYVSRASSTDWFGAHVASSKDGTLSGGPVVVYLRKGCDHNEDVEEVLVKDFGYGRGEDVERADELVAHGVVAGSLAEYLSLVAACGFADLCRHVSSKDIAGRRRSAAPGTAAAAESLLALEGVIRIADPAAALKNAPKVRLAMPSVAQPSRAARKADAALLQAFLDDRLRGTSSALLKYAKLTRVGAKDGVELKLGASGMREPVETLEARAGEALRAWNADHPEMPIGSFIVQKRGKRWVKL